LFYILVFFAFEKVIRKRLFMQHFSSITKERILNLKP